ncbi:hypothetical protein V6N13_048995 [Hibiscus sabdariffa]
MLMQTDEVQDDELIASTGLEDLSNCPLDSLKDEILVITFNEPIQDPFGHLRATTQNYVGSISPNQFAIVDESHQTCQLKQMENNTEGVKTSYIKVDSLPKLIVNLLNASSSMKAQDVRDCLLGWTDPSDFEDIYDVGHSIDFLKVEVYIIRRLPKRFSGKYGFEALEMPLVSWANEKYCIEQILLLFSKHKVVHFNRIYTRLVNNGNPLDLQKLRCSGNFQGLSFTLQIETLRHKLVCILQGPFVALHLVYDMDMLAFLGCTHDCTVEKEYGRVKASHILNILFLLKVKWWFA